MFQQMQKLQWPSSKRLQSAVKASVYCWGPTVRPAPKTLREMSSQRVIPLQKMMCSSCWISVINVANKCNYFIRDEQSGAKHSSQMPELLNTLRQLDIRGTQCWRQRETALKASLKEGIPKGNRARGIKRSPLTEETVDLSTSAAGRSCPSPANQTDSPELFLSHQHLIWNNEQGTNAFVVYFRIVQCILFCVD